MGRPFRVPRQYRKHIGRMVEVLTTDGRTTSGMGGAKVDQEGRLWFVGAFSEPDPRYQVRAKRAYSMGLGCYDPFRK